MNEKVEKEGGNKSRLYAVLAIAVAAVVLVASAAFLVNSNQNPGPATVLNPTARHVGSENMTAVSIPLADISQTATWYEYNMSGATLRFFVVKDSDGIVHSAFDECWMCFAVREGYHQNGSSMIENCCDMPFPISQITEQGCSGDGCCPIWLKSVVVGDSLMIMKKDLARQRLIFLNTEEHGKVSVYNSTHVSIALAGVSQEATWYKVDIGSTTVRFFAVKEANGTVHTSFDECWKCYPRHLGYRQQNATHMMESCCNMAFPIASITPSGTAITKCHPVYLPSVVIGDRIVISLSDIEAGVYLFADA